MAKQIKVIKCPQCGSVQNIEIKPDYFKCSSCGTEYFLDNDDININHTYTYNTPNVDQLKPVAKKLLTVFWVVMGVILFSNVLSWIFVKKPVHNRVTSVVESKVDYKWDRKEVSFFESVDKKPVFAVVGTRSRASRYDSDKNIYAGFYNAENSKELKMQELDVKSASFDVKFKSFDNGDLYFIVNKSRLFKIDRQYLKAEEVSPDTYKNLPDLESGFAKIEFVYSGDGDGFNIMTNEGKQVYYYPLIQKVYSKKTFYAAQRGFDTLPANATTRTGFTFSSKSIYYEDMKLQLIKYQYKYALGYPRSNPMFSLEKDFGRLGRFTDSDPYHKVLISKWGKNSARLASFKDFTPGRLYFKPKVLAFDEKTVLIAFCSTPAEDSPYSVQLLDAETAKVLWTYPIEDKLYLYDALKTTNGYYINGNIYDLYVDNNGKKVNAFKL